VVDGLLLGGVLAPAGLSTSFVHAEFAAAVDALTQWRRSVGQEVELSPIDLGMTLASIEPFEAPWTKELLFDCGEWTAYLNNGIDGGDPTAAAPSLANELGVDLLVAIPAPPHGPGRSSTQLWVLGPSGTPPLMYRRTVSADCADGRWSWHAHGEPLPFEDLARYGARRIRDRFDRPMLIDYLRANGIRADERDFWGNGVLIRQSVPYSTRQETAEQVRNRFGW
jgi:hypothetical protein